MERYAVVVHAIPEEEGGCFIAYVPDLPGCMSDGDTPQEAMENVQDAITSWLEANREMGREAPRPGRAVENARRERKAWMDMLKAAAEAIEARDGHIASLELKVDRLTELLEREPEDRFGLYMTSKSDTRAVC